MCLSTVYTFKIRITLNLEELKNKNVDFHSFMSNPIETQSFFLDMLDEAEREIGFSTENYRIAIEALAMSNGNFIFTVTRIQEQNKFTKKKLHIKKKIETLGKSNTSIFEFENFEDFCDFCNYLNNSIFVTIKDYIKSNILYKYNEKYYLVFKNNKIEPIVFNSFCTSMSEFAKSIRNAETFENKLKEYGTIIVKTNAIKTGLKYF